ncbi:MAG: tail fiber protein [Marinomonas hwangdonensis]|nr:tail fiber protein [Marinomonas hwangdonensis]
MKKILIATAALGSLMAGQSAYACSPDSYIGSLCVTAGAWCPRGFLETSGGTVAISDQQALYAVIGTAYGGNGVSTFQLPDLRGRTPVGYGSMIGTRTAPVTMGQQRGVEVVALSSSNMPSMSANLSGVSASGNITITGAVKQGSGSPDGTSTSGSLAGTAGSGPTAVKLYSSSDSNITVPVNIPVTGTATIAGQGSPVYNLPPQLGVRYCINTSGIFPQRPD